MSLLQKEEHSLWNVPSNRLLCPGFIGRWTSLPGVRCAWSRCPAKCLWCRQPIPVCPAPQVRSSRTPAMDHFSCSNSSRVRKPQDQPLICSVSLPVHPLLTPVKQQLLLLTYTYCTLAACVSFEVYHQWRKCYCHLSVKAYLNTIFPSKQVYKQIKEIESSIFSNQCLIENFCQCHIHFIFSQIYCACKEICFWRLLHQAECCILN